MLSFTGKCLFGNILGIIFMTIQYGPEGTRTFVSLLFQAAPHIKLFSVPNGWGYPSGPIVASLQGWLHLVAVHCSRQTENYVKNLEYRNAETSAAGGFAAENISVDQIETLDEGDVSRIRYNDLSNSIL
jgi:hypothetical protein